MKSLTKLQAVILTGGRDTHGPLLHQTGLRSKVMLSVGGQPMVLSVLEALARVHPQPELWLSAQDPLIMALETDIRFGTLPSDTGAVLSILRALDYLPPSEWVLFATGDHPLLTAEMVEYFIEAGIKRDAALVAAVVERETVRQKYPQSQRTYFRAKDGAYSGGNLFLLNRKKFRPNFTFMETMDRNRKQPWKSAFMLDIKSLVQIAFKQLTIEQVAQRASQALGCEADVIVMPFAECCMDVDKPSDKALAEIILNRLNQRTKAETSNPAQEQPV